MATIISNLLLVTLQYAILNGSKRFVRTVYRPYGPKMCKGMCNNTQDEFFFMKEDLSCHRMLTNQSASEGSTSIQDSVNCPEKDTPTGDNTYLPQVLGWNVCHTESESDDEYHPILRHEISNSTLDGELDLLHPNRNITLHQACEVGKLCVVRVHLSQRPADIDLRGKRGRTPVMVAARNGQMGVFDFLVNQGCNMSAVDDHRNTVLHIACMGGNVYIVKKLVVGNKTDIECKNEEGRTSMMISGYFGHIKLVMFLVSRGCRWTGVDIEGNNILHLACNGGHVDMVDYILSQKKLALESKGYFGRTPVMFAAHFGHVELVKFLVNVGSNLRVIDNQGNNMLHVACIGGHLAMVRYILLQKTHDIESKDAFGRTPVMTAVYFGRRELVRFIVNMGCTLTVLDNSKNNILHMACMGGDIEMVKYLISLRIVKEIWRDENKHKRSPLQLAQLNGYKGIVALLRRRLKMTKPYI